MPPEGSFQIKSSGETPPEITFVPKAVPQTPPTVAPAPVPQVVPPNPITEAIAQNNVPTQEPEGSHLKQIRTFEGDVADAIKKQNESLISIQRKEEKRRDAVQTLSPNAGQQVEHRFSFKPLMMALFTIIFIGGGGYGAYYALTTYQEKTALPVVNTPKNQFLGVSKTISVDASTLGRQAVIDEVVRVRSEQRDGDSLDQIQFERRSGETSELLAFSDFLTRLNSHAPNPLVRAFDPLFMFGVLSSSPSHSVLIVKLKSFENAFPGMLEWEGRLVEDMLPLFIDPTELAGIATNSIFKDKTIQNHDTRVLRNSYNQIVLIYGFFDNDTLIMTDDESSFRTIINRLQAEKLSR